MDNISLWLGLAALVVIIIALFVSDKVKAMFSIDGFSIATVKNKNPEKEKTSIEKVRNESDISIESQSNRDVSIKDIDKSKIKIK